MYREIVTGRILKYINIGRRQKGKMAIFSLTFHLLYMLDIQYNCQCQVGQIYSEIVTNSNLKKIYFEKDKEGNIIFQYSEGTLI